MEFYFFIGGLLNDIIVNIQNKINNKDPTQLYMYGIVSLLEFQINFFYLNCFTTPN